MNFFSWLKEEFLEDRLYVTIALYAGIAAGIFTMSFIADHGFLPETNSITIEHEPSYLGYGVVEENTTTYYETKEDEIQGHINLLIIAAASLAVGIVAGLLMSVVLYFIDKRIVWLHEEEGPK